MSGCWTRQVGLHRISLVRASEEVFRTGSHDALEGTRDSCPWANRSVGVPSCPALPRPVAPPCAAPTRPDPPVVCPDFGFDWLRFTGVTQLLVCDPTGYEELVVCAGGVSDGFIIATGALSGCRRNPIGVSEGCRELQDGCWKIPKGVSNECRNILWGVSSGSWGAYTRLLFCVQKRQARAVHPYSHQFLDMPCMTCRIQNRDLPRAGRHGAAHGGTAGPGGDGPHRTPTGLFAQEKTAPFTPQTMEE